jgi:hypothetical protein
MEEPEKFIREELGHYFKVKENSIGPHDGSNPDFSENGENL